MVLCVQQEIAWFDTNNTTELSTRIKGDTLIIKQGESPWWSL